MSSSDSESEDFGRKTDGNPTDNGWQKWKKNLEERLEFTHRHHVFDDVRFRVEVRRPTTNTMDVQHFNAHRLVLSITSPVFAQQFYGDKSQFRLDGDTDYRVTDIEHRAFATMLKYMYEGERGINFETMPLALQTYKAAKKFKVEHLKELCGEHLRSTQLSAKDVVPIIEDPLHVEIHGLRQQCIDVAEDKPTDVIRIAAETGKPSTIDMLLQMEKLAVSSEFVLLKALVEGATSRCQKIVDHSPGSLKLEGFVRQFLKHIRFLTMTPQEFALSVDLCGKAITNEEGYAILLALSHPMAKIFQLPTWCNQAIRCRISQARNILEIGLLPAQPVFEEYDVDEETRSLISVLEIKVHGGRFTFTSVVLYCRRIVDELTDIGESRRPSVRCTLNIRNNAAGIALEQVKDIVFDRNDFVLPFPIPLPVSQGQEAKVTVTLDNPVSLSFSRFLNPMQNVGDEQSGFEICLNNYRFQDDSFAISKLYYME